MVCHDRLCVQSNTFLGAGAKKLEMIVPDSPFFDTVRLQVKSSDAQFIAKKAADEGVNLRLLDDKTLTISLSETTTLADINQLFFILNNGNKPGFTAESLAEKVWYPPSLFNSCSEV